MKTMLKTAAFTALAALALNTASAGTTPSPKSLTKMFSVAFDNVTGTGFVGKGDVQLVYGWNNAQLQNNAAGVSFHYYASESWDAVCVWVTGEGRRGEKTHRKTRSKTTTVNATIQYEMRNNKKGAVTGFMLNGYGSYTITGDTDAPEVGGSCPGEGTNGTWESVTSVESIPGSLYVSYGGNSVAMPNTPVVVVL